MSVKETIKRTIQGLAKTKSGAEICDPKPKVLPTGIKRPPTQEQRLMNILNAHKHQMQHDQEYVDETDFEIDEPDMLSPYEQQAVVFETIPQIPAVDEGSDVSGREEPSPKPSSTAEQSGEAANGGEATAQPSASADNTQSV